jgi:glycine betaine/proline transport system permease protein
MAGLNQTIMLSLSMVVIAGAGRRQRPGRAGGAGAEQRQHRLGFESGLVIVVVAIMLDRMLRVRRND